MLKTPPPMQPYGLHGETNFSISPKKATVLPKCTLRQHDWNHIKATTQQLALSAWILLCQQKPTLLLKMTLSSDWRTLTRMLWSTNLPRRTPVISSSKGPLEMLFNLNSQNKLTWLFVSVFEYPNLSSNSTTQANLQALFMNKQRVTPIR